MKIYVGHSSSFDYKKDLYQPIKNSELNTKHEIILPHEHSIAPTNTQEKLKTMNLFIAEVSHPSTGLGIELGWANSINLPIIAIHKTDRTVSSSIATITKQIHEYANEHQLISKLTEIIGYETVLNPHR